LPSACFIGGRDATSVFFCAATPVSFVFEAVDGLRRGGVSVLRDAIVAEAPCTSTARAKMMATRCRDVFVIIVRARAARLNTRLPFSGLLGGGLDAHPCERAVAQVESRVFEIVGGFDEGGKRDVGFLRGACRMNFKLVQRIPELGLALLATRRATCAARWGHSLVRPPQTKWVE